VTVTELAAEAGVTERTFFRHFATKEAVLFEDYETQLEWLAEALAR
jgi:AcrR family transcriptional regulator